MTGSRCKIRAFLFSVFSFVGIGVASSTDVRAQEFEEWSVWDGVYTQAQADEGAEVFVRSCIACHATKPGEVAGHAPAPSLIGEDFAYRWTDSSIADLFDTIRQTMPQAAPNSLSAEEYAQLTAYILKLNHYPSGSNAIEPGDRERLLETYIDADPPTDPLADDASGL